MSLVEWAPATRPCLYTLADSGDLWERTAWPISLLVAPVQNIHLAVNFSFGKDGHVWKKDSNVNIVIRALAFTNVTFGGDEDDGRAG